MEYQHGPDHTHDKTGVHFLAIIIWRDEFLKKVDSTYNNQGPDTIGAYGIPTRARPYTR